MPATVSRDELISSLSTFTKIAELTADVYIVFDRQINILYINQAVFPLIGYTPAEIMADTFASVFPEEEKIIRLTLDYAVENKLSNVPGVYSRHLHKQTGKIVWIQFNATLVYRDGEFEYGFACGKDHTEAVIREEEITRLNKRLEETEEVAGFGSWEMDFSNGRYFWSKGFRALFGYAPEDDLNNIDAVLRLVHPDDLGLVEPQYRPLSRDKIVDSEMEFRIILPGSGQVKNIKSITTGIFRDNVLAGVKGVCQDVTTDRHLGKTLQHTINQYEIITQNSQDIIAILNPDLTVKFISPSIEKITGYSTDELTANPQLIFDPAENAVFFQQFSNQLRQVQEHGFYKAHCTTKDGVFKQLEIAITFVFSVNAELEYVVCVARDITERLANIQALETANANLLKNQLLAEMGNWEFDLRLNRYEWSEGTRAIYEVHAGTEPVTGEELIKFIHPEDVSIVHDASLVKQAALTSNMQCENRIITAKGKIKSLRHIINPVYENGALVKLTGITLDITRQREYESQILKSQEQFKILYDSMHQGVIFQDREGTVYDANSTALKLFGLESKHIKFERIREQYLTREGKEIPESDYPHREVLKNNQPVFGRVLRIINRRTKAERVVRIDCFPLKHERENSVYGVFTLFEDITALTKSFDLLKISNQKFSDAFYSSGIGMILVDKQNNFLEVNEMFCKILGYSSSRLWKIPFHDLMHEEDRAYHIHKNEQLWMGKIQTYQHEKRYYHKSGRIIWAILTSSAVRNKNGETLYIVSQFQDVTQLKEEQLLRQESETKYKALIESSTMGISITRNFKIVYANTRLRKMFGYKASEPVDLINLDHLATPETKKIIENRYKRLREGKAVIEPFIGEYVIRGVTKSFEINVKNIRLSGEPFRMVMINDITDRVASQKKLSETERVFRVAQNFAKVGTWNWNVASGEIFWSDTTYRIFGLRKRAFMTLPLFLKSVDARDKAWLAEELKSNIQNRTSFTLEYRIRSRNQVKWMATSGKVVRDRNGTLVEIFGIVRDITRDKLEQDKIQRILKKLKLKNEVIDSANRRLTESQRELSDTNQQLELKNKALNEMAIVVTYDSNGLMTDVNDRFVEVYGYGRSEVINRAYGIRINSIYNSGFHDRRFFEGIWAALRKGQVWRGEICNRAKSGKVVWVLKTVVPLMNDRGKLDKLFSFSEDITLLKERERETVEAKELAEKASLAKEEFLSVMSHEIRTPLNSVIGLGNLLLKKSPREDQVEIMQSLKNSGDNLLHLVNDILDYNKIQVHKVELEEFEFNTRAWLGQVNASFKTLASEKGLAFQVKLDTELPEFIVGDRTRATQILNNLISNALKFTRRGYVHVLVTVSAVNTDDSILSFEIQDSGIGISKEKLGMLDKPFIQAEKSISRRFGGTGLGLSIVKGLLELMNGTLEVSSTPGKGSSFIARIPFRKAFQSFKNASSKVDNDETIQNLRGVRMLYVEDVESNRFLVHNIMQHAGVTCTTVPDGRAALVVSARTRFDVILMDIQMPVMNGYQVTQAIKNQRGGKNNNTPVIAFTAESPSAELKERILEQGFHDYLHKPFETEVLLEKIAGVIHVEDKGVVSFRFYEHVFKHDPQKLRRIKRMVIKEFHQFEVEFLQACRQKDELVMREKIHALRPILKNLQCSGILFLLNQYSFGDWRAVSKLNSKLKKLLKEVNKQVQEYKPLKSPVMSKLLRKKLNVLVHLAKIDGKFDDREKKFIHRLLEENGYGPERLEEDNSPVTPAEMATLKGREELLYWIIKLMHADGVIHPSEVAYCKTVAQQLGFNTEIIDHYTTHALPSFTEFVEEVTQQE